MRPSIISSSQSFPAIVLVALALTFVPVEALTDTPGTQVGITTYDQQHVGSPGRQVAEDFGLIQVTWCRSTWFHPSVGRSIGWQKVPVAGSPVPMTLDNGAVVNVLPLGALGCGLPECPDLRFGDAHCNPGFRTLPSGRGTWVTRDSSMGFNANIVQCLIDADPAAGILAGVVLPDPTGHWGVSYPKHALSVVGTDTVIHVIGTETDTTNLQRVYYWRGILNDVQVDWSLPVVIDSVQTLSAVIEASPVSDDVAIVYTHPRNGAADIYDNDVAYRLSTDGGLTWGPATTLYSAAGRDQAFADVGAVFDLDNTLHVIFNTVYRDPALGVPFGPCNLYHWNSARGFTRPVASAAWTNTCSQVDSLRGGLWDLRLNKPNLSVKPAGAGPGGGIADELIYAVWVQFGPTETDCATQDSAGTPGGYVNGEIWCSVSSDDGLTWDWPQNITGTETPDCLPGDCHSEQWVTAAAYADSGLYLSYLDDTHAGAIVAREGAWSTSPYMAYAVATRDPAATPRIWVAPVTVPFPRCIGGDEYFMELSIVVGADSTFAVKIGNLGTSTLDYDAAVQPDDGGTAHILVDGGTAHTGSIAAAANDDVLSVHYQATGLAVGSNHQWLITIASNDPVCDTIDLNLNVSVADSLASIRGATFHDRNANGVWEPASGEEGLSGWTVRADPGGLSAVTDDSGFYAIQGLSAGTYTVTEVLLPRWSRTSPVYPVTHTFTLAEQQDTTGIDFGNLYCMIEIPGDVNESGALTSADVIYLVNYVFKGGAVPQPCEANGDVDCNGVVTASDIIYMVGYVFGGGMAPCDICGEPPAMECVAP